MDVFLHFVHMLFKIFLAFEFENVLGDKVRKFTFMTYSVIMVGFDAIGFFRYKRLDERTASSVV